MYLKRFFFRLFNLLFGIVLYAFGLVGTIKANIGYSPWDVLHAGLANSIGLRLGFTSVIVGVVIVAVVTLSGEKLGIGTLAGMILTGTFMDIIMLLDIIPPAGNFIIGVTMMIAGLFVVAVGSYFYMKSGFGAGPRDNLMVVLTRRTKLPVGICRLLIEILVTLAGWLLGGMAGIGTVIAAVAIGFCVQIVFRLFRFDATAIKHETIADTYAALSGKKTSEKTE